MSVAIPTIVAIIDDIRKPEGITRRIFYKIKSGILLKSKKRITENSDIYLKKNTNTRKLKNS